MGRERVQAPSNKIARKPIPLPYSQTPATRPSSSSSHASFRSWVPSIREIRPSSPLASPRGSRQSLVSSSQGPATRPSSSHRQRPVSPVSPHPSEVSLSQLSLVSTLSTSTPPQPFQHPAPPKPTTKPPSGLSGWFRGRKSKK